MSTNWFIQFRQIYNLIHRSINHILIVIKNSDWEGKIGDALRDIITQPVAGLPQEENQFSINHVAPETFNQLFKRSRNIMFVGFDDETQFYTNSNIYADRSTFSYVLNLH